MYYVFVSIQMKTIESNWMKALTNLDYLFSHNAVLWRLALSNAETEVMIKLWNHHGSQQSPKQITESDYDDDDSDDSDVESNKFVHGLEVKTNLIEQ